MARTSGPARDRVEAEHLEVAAVGRVQAEDQAEQRGLAGAVGAEQAGDARCRPSTVTPARAVDGPKRLTTPSADEDGGIGAERYGPALGDGASG